MLDKKRMGEIAYAILKHKYRKEGLRLNPDFRRDIGNQAKDLGIPKDELMAFVEHVVREMVDEMFAKPEESQDPLRSCP